VRRASQGTTGFNRGCSGNSDDIFDVKVVVGEIRAGKKKIEEIRFIRSISDIRSFCNPQEV
jgi:hypothetical protein